MLMKANKKYINRMVTLALAGSLFGAGLSACSDDVTTPEEPIVTPPGNEDGKYFLTLNVSVPNAAGTRNSTDQNGTSGEEIPGTAKESVLNQATIYFTVNNEVKFSFESDYIEAYPTDITGKTHQIRIKIDDKISNFADLVGEENVQMFIVGNTTDLYNPEGVAKGDNLTDATFSIGSINADVIGDFGNDGHTMPLMNAKKVALDFSATALNLTIDSNPSTKDKINAVVQKYFTKNTGTILWWEVGDVIDLERGVARLEFKDIDRTGTRAEANSNSTLEPYCYRIGSTGVIVQLHALTPFNVNKESYLFRHTAKGNYSKANTAASLFGVENGYAGTDYNWVAGSDWSFSSGVFTKSPSFWNALNVTNMSSAPDDWAYKLGTSGPAGSDDGTVLVTALESRSNGSEDKFHPWCYVSENTLPSTELFQHHKEVSSTTEPGGTTTGTVTTVPVITANATGVLFTVKVMNADGTAELKYSPTKSGYPSEIDNAETNDHIVITMSDGKWVELSPDNDGCYYMKYIACIVHNQPQTGTSGYVPMQYGVVRNNTYQIQVSGIPSIPLPRDPQSLWIQLQIQVKPWTVRYNEIEF